MYLNSVLTSANISSSNTPKTIRTIKPRNGVLSSISLSRNILPVSGITNLSLERDPSFICLKTNKINMKPLACPGLFAVARPISSRARLRLHAQP